MKRLWTGSDPSLLDCTALSVDKYQLPPLATDTTLKYATWRHSLPFLLLCALATPSASTTNNYRFVQVSRPNQIDHRPSAGSGWTGLGWLASPTRQSCLCHIYHCSAVAIVYSRNARTCFLSFRKTAAFFLMPREL